MIYRNLFRFIRQTSDRTSSPRLQSARAIRVAQPVRAILRSELSRRPLASNKDYFPPFRLFADRSDSIRPAMDWITLAGAFPVASGRAALLPIAFVGGFSGVVFRAMTPFPFSVER
jgi:hypothetical protein